MAAVKVLMADDEEDVLEVMARRVSAAGYEVVTAHDGQEAWERICADAPDVIMLDVNMPRMDGFAVLRRLRESPPTEKWQPVVIVSARTELQDVRQGYALEADHYLTKPCRMEDILKAIEMMLRLIPQRRSGQDGV